MDSTTIFAAPHRRLNPLTGEWLLVSPQRTARPWSGQVEQKPAEQRPSYDPTCYLCPGNERASGPRNPHYKGTFVFENAYAAFPPAPPGEEYTRGVDGGAPLRHAKSERGICGVVFFPPRHDLTLAGMEPGALRRVVETWV